MSNERRENPSTSSGYRTEAQRRNNPSPASTSPSESDRARRPFVHLDISSQFVLEVLNQVLGFPISTLLGKVELKSKVIGFLPDLEISASLRSPQASILGIHTEGLAIDLELQNPQNLQTLRVTASLRVPRVRVYGIDLTNLTASVSLEEGYLNISNLSAKVFDGELVGGLGVLIDRSKAVSLKTKDKSRAFIPSSTLALRLTSSVLKMNLDGEVNLQNRRLNLQIDASSPELQRVLKEIVYSPPPPLWSWLEGLQGELVYLKGKITGPLAQPGFQGDLLLKEIKLPGGGIQQVKGRVIYPGPGNQQVELDLVDVRTPYQSFDHASLLIRQSDLGRCPDNRPGRCPDSIIFSFQARKGNSLLKGNGSVDLDKRTFEARLEGENLNLTDLNGLQDIASPYRGQVDIALKGSGPLANPQAQGYLRFKNLEFENRPVPDILAEAALRDRQLKLTVNAFNGEYMAALTLFLSPALDYEFNLVMRQASVERALGFFRPLERVTGVVSGQIFSEGSLKNLKEASARVTLNPVNLRIYNRNFVNEGPFELAITRQKVSFKSVQLVERATGFGLFLQGDLNFSGRLNLGIDGLLDLRFAQPFVPRRIIRELSGNAQVLLDVRGTYQNPEFNGVVEISQGFVSLADYPDPFTEIRGKARLKKNQIELVGIKTQLPDRSRLEASGSLSLKGRSLSSVNLDIRGQNATFQLPDEAISVKTNANLTLTGRPGAFLLSGRASILSAQYLRRLDLQSLIRDIERRRALREPGQPPTPGLGLSVEVKTPRTVGLTGPSVDLRLQVDLRIRGSVRRPEIQGRIETTTGTLSFEDRTYTLSSGSLDFIDPTRINPDVNLQASTDIRNYRVFITLQGNLEDFSLDLSSDPPLPERDIAALLAFGGTTGQLLGTVETLGAERVAGLLIPPVQSQFGGRLERLTRLDRVEVEPLGVQNGAEPPSFAPTVVLGKELFEDLFVTFTTTVGASQERQVVQLKYVISNRFSLVVERDNENQTNVSARFRFEFK